MPGAASAGVVLRVRGLVQGVGFRPTVWRLAHECGVHGDVRNDGAGLLIHAFGGARSLARFLRRLEHEPPPLARIDSIERESLAAPPVRALRDFRIVESARGGAHTAVLPDAASCALCVDEVLAKEGRRSGYAFTNCTHCGPRFSIVRAIPYDRRNTSMASFALCPDCSREYGRPSDRRFHAQPTACPACGPRVAIELADSAPSASDPLAHAVRLLRDGAIVAVKGLGGFHLACDATNADAVERLRTRKHRDCKPFALMAASVSEIRRYCDVDAMERAALQSAAAPIVLLSRHNEDLPPGIAPGSATLGFMLPYTPLHHLLVRGVGRPLVLTSGNRSDEPQCTDNAEARERLHAIADAWLAHDRKIVNRIDDSVVRVMDGAPRVLRRARGYAPAPLTLARGFERAPPVVALGGMLKSTFCLLAEGRAVVAQHQGDLDHPLAFADYRRNLERYRELFEHAPECIAVDGHPDYPSTRLGIEWAQRSAIRLVTVAHHHAHVASCLAENGVALDASPVLGIALDGLGMGDDGALWGGEFLLADYRGFRRLASLKPVALPGGSQAIRQPWRNTYAHLASAFGAQGIPARYRGLALVRFLDQPRQAALGTLLAKGLNSPAASSCGRLFDAVAAALNICRERADYEGQAAIELEALAARADDGDYSPGYPFALEDCADMGIVSVDPTAMWVSLLDDLVRAVSPATIAARFHRGLSRAIAATAQRCAGAERVDTVALSGGVFHNRILLELVATTLRGAGLRVLTHRQVPAGDGGLALGQAAVAAARCLSPEESPCA